MNPAKALSRWGQAQTRRVNLATGEVVFIPPDPNRIVLIFWGTSGSVFISPQAYGVETFDPTVFDTGQPPIMITHALHGQVVNLSWRLEGGVPPGPITWIEAFMPEEGREEHVWLEADGIPSKRNVLDSVTR